MPDVTTRLPKLIVKSPQGTTKDIDITKSGFTIGRKSDNDLALEDPAVSGHHAKIVKIQEVLFLEDLASTNGTFVNEHKTDRKQLKDADVIRIGTYRIIYRSDDPASSKMPTLPLSPPTEDRTVVYSGPAAKDRAAMQPIATVLVITGKTDRPEYTLQKQLSVIGAQEDAAVKLTGWFAPKAAATIGRNTNDYFISMTEGGKKILLNGRTVLGHTNLSDGDVIEVAGVKLRFSLREEKGR